MNLMNCWNLSDDSLEILKNCDNIQEFGLKGVFLFNPSSLENIGENCLILLKFSLELEHSIDITLAI